MSLRDTWKDLQDKVAGDENSGSDISVTPINNIAHSVIKNEEDISELNKIVEPFYVTLNTDDGKTIISVDKTYSEIKAAYNIGKTIKLRFVGTNSYFDLLEAQYNAFYFSRVLGNTNVVVKIGANLGDNQIFNYNFAEQFETDNTPTKDSDNLITSGGVYSSLNYELIGETIVTEADITEAGEEGITAIYVDVGDNLSHCRDLLIKIYAPVNSENTTSSPLRISALANITSNPDSDPNLIFSSQSATYAPVYYNYKNRITVEINLNDKGEVLKGLYTANGFSSNAYPVTAYGFSYTVGTIINKKYICIKGQASASLYKFGAGSKVQVYRR